jgi:putative PIG3 family NAD(P)H quinone oxidoreductase
MKAAVYRGKGGLEVIGIEDRPVPEYGPEQVLVRVQASALNRADTMQRAGNYPAPPGAPADIPGLEFAGVVEAVGSGVGSVRVGQRVFGITAGGGQAEYVVSQERLLVGVPDNLSMSEAAAVPEAFITAADALFALAGLASGETVLVHAVGSGVGLAALQLAKAAGCSVFGTSRSADKLARAAELGLDLGIDTTQQDFAEVVAERTGKRGVEVVIDFVGAPYLAGNLAALATRGRLVEVASMGGVRGELNIGLLMRKRIQIVGTVLRARPLEEKGMATRLFADRVVPQLASGLVRANVDRVFPLEELAEAHRYMEADRNFGKIVLSLDPLAAPV